VARLVYRIVANIFFPAGDDNRQARTTLAVVILSAAVSAGCGVWPRTAEEESPEPAAPAVRVPSEPLDVSGVGFPPDGDSLATALMTDVETTPVEDLGSVEDRIRDWLASFQFEDPSLLPLDRPVSPARYHRRMRGRLLDALGVAALRRGDLRQAEAALVSAVSELNSRGTTTDYAAHFLHLGRVHEARGRLDAAIEAYLDAEARGMGVLATPALEAAWRRRYGSFRGLDARRGELAARIEDERRQLVVAGAVSEPLPRFRWPRRTGPPRASSELLGRAFVLAVWDDEGERWPASLEPLARTLRARGAELVGVYVGDDPAAVDPTRSFSVLLPPEPRDARRRLAADALPTLLVVDEAGSIRYRHDRSASTRRGHRRADRSPAGRPGSLTSRRTAPPISEEGR